jgi:hypothetical protein
MATRRSKTFGMVIASDMSAVLANYSKTKTNGIEDDPVRERIGHLERMIELALTYYRKALELEKEINNELLHS